MSSNHKHFWFHILSDPSTKYQSQSELIVSNFTEIKKLSPHASWIYSVPHLSTEGKRDSENHPSLIQPWMKR